MKLENQVCSLELAKKLKDLGVKQENLFIWSEHTKPETLWSVAAYEGSVAAYEEKYDHTPTYPTYSAFTVAELGEILKDVHKYKLPYHYTKDYWAVQNLVEETYANTEADARAKFLIYLLENKLLTLPT